MASKEKLKDQRDDARGTIESQDRTIKRYQASAREMQRILADLRDEFDELREAWDHDKTEYEADLNASKARESLLKVKLEKHDALLRERDGLLRQVQDIRVRLESVMRAVNPLKIIPGAMGGGYTSAPLSIPGSTVTAGGPGSAYMAPLGSNSGLGIAPAKKLTLNEFFQDLNRKAVQQQTYGDKHSYR